MTLRASYMQVKSRILKTMRDFTEASAGPFFPAKF